VGFSLLELVCVFSKYEFLHCAFLVSLALFHVSYLKIAYIPKLMERFDQSPIFYLFLFIKRYLFLYNKRRQQLAYGLLEGPWAIIFSFLFFSLSLFFSSGHQVPLILLSDTCPFFPLRWVSLYP